MRRTHCDEALEDDMTDSIDQRKTRCQRCGTEFKKTRNWQKFCSRECKDRYWREIRAEITMVILERRKD